MQLLRAMSAYSRGAAGLFYKTRDEWVHNFQRMQPIWLHPGYFIQDMKCGSFVAHSHWWVQTDMWSSCSTVRRWDMRFADNYLISKSLVRSLWYLPIDIPTFSLTSLIDRHCSVHMVSCTRATVLAVLKMDESTLKDWSTNDKVSLLKQEYYWNVLGELRTIQKLILQHFKKVSVPVFLSQKQKFLHK